MACDSEITVFEENTSTKPKCKDAWESVGGNGYVCFDEVYSDTTGRISYKLPFGLYRQYMDIREGYTYTKI